MEKLFTCQNFSYLYNVAMFFVLLIFLGEEMTYSQIDLNAINTIRFLSLDMIQKANSGHPGLPLGAAPATYVLWNKFLKINPKNSKWEDRDRFVLSAGHGSALLYSLLHLNGFDLSIEDLKNFRQLHSKTPGHPEFGITDGVETSTGPLGQGVANAVGMAIAEKMLAEKFNRENFEIVNHFTYALVGDGDLMEGIASEACSLAGHLGLGKLVLLYDSNDVTLDGKLSKACSENVAKRFESYGFQVLTVKDGDTDLDSIEKAIDLAKKELSKPTLIEIKTTIGYGSPSKSGKNSAHGAPLGEEEIKTMKKAWGFDPEKHFAVSEEVQKHFEEIVNSKMNENKKWNELFNKYSKKYPKLANDWKNFQSLNLPENWEESLEGLEFDEKIATRASNGKIMNAFAKKIEWFVGGDADLSSSTKTFLKDLGSFGTDNFGRNIHFGIREHAMAGILNGICFHGGLRPFSATFFSFVDYMRPSIRISALSDIAPVFIFTHDSVAVGEDGPTHQPIEQLASVRSIPNLTVLRPSDATENVAAWKHILTHKEPTVLVLTRQNTQTIDRNKFASENNLEKGAYQLNRVSDPDLIIMASGSEVEIAMNVADELEKESIEASVVSFPSWELFEKQSAEYKESVFPRNITKRVSIEAGISMGWCKYSGTNGLNIAIDKFGTSAPAKDVLKDYDFDLESITKRIKQYMK